MMDRIRAGIAICAILISSSCLADASYPAGPVRIIGGASPGGSIDSVARLIAPVLFKKWGQPVVVENKPGAEGILAADAVARAAPDGYTLLLATSNHTITASRYKLTYDPVKSFSPVVLMVRTLDFLLVNPTVLPVTSVSELVAYAKANPGKLNYSSSGVGSVNYIEMGLFARMAGLDMVNITYKGGSPAMMALLSGETQLAFATTSDSIQHVKAGKFRALATSMKARSQLMLSVPPLSEASDLTDFDISQWYGILAPAGTPPEIVKKLRDDIAEAIKSPEVQQQLAERGFITDASVTSADFGATIARDIAVWNQRLRDVGAYTGELQEIK